jgi:hypothetical protein
LAERAIVIQLAGDAVLVASLDDLIAMKRAAGRTKDRLAIVQLEAIKEMGSPPI